MFCLGIGVSSFVCLGMFGLSYGRMGVKGLCMHGVFATRLKNKLRAQWRGMGGEPSRGLLFFLSGKHSFCILVFQLGPRTSSRNDFILCLRSCL